MLLELNSVHAFYGKIEALRGVSLRVREHAIVSLLGANGAGKTTTVRTIVGLHRSPGNDIRFDNAPIGNVPPHQIVGLGISMVPERRELFPNMSVIDNLEMGAYRRRDRADVRRALDWIFGLFPVLAERRRERAGALSGGQQQMLAIAQALVASPSVLMLDEPTAGLAPSIAKELFATLDTLKRQGLGVLLVEQMVEEALAAADHVTVMEQGRSVLSGLPSEIDSSVIREIYMGGSPV
jgi:branched-chain amino acid transport system ATP-binding protein